MPDTLRVQWTITRTRPPSALRHCRRCGCPKAFAPSGKFRLNANGKKIDAWLIYRCGSCEETWNRPVLERRPVASLTPSLLGALRDNDPALALRIAHDIADLRRWTAAPEAASPVVVRRRCLSSPPIPPGSLEILCVVPHPVAIRLDRLLAGELEVPRTRIREAAGAGVLQIRPGGTRALKRPVCDGATLELALPPADGPVVRAAAAAARRASDGL